jgi:DNA-binding transcriptional LysR family regulator
MDWDKLRVFHAVAEAGSFTHAGASLNLSQSSVSRQVGALESSLNTSLFHRHARGLRLTESGATLFQTAKEVFAKLAKAEAVVSESRDRPKGPLRINTTIAFGAIWLTERLKDFIETYPEISVTLMLSEDELDLSMGEADVAIRMTPPSQGDLVQLRLATMRHHAFALPSYLNKFGTPQRLDELDQHQLIAYDQTIRSPYAEINWILGAGRGDRRPRRPVLRLNNIYAMYRAAASGLGIASLPDYLGQLARDLVPVLPEMEGPVIDIYFVYPEELRHSQRIVAFRNFLVGSIAFGNI